jgi:dephospho-CoA kinase
MENVVKPICRWGITGEIGAGKSTVAAFIAQLGIPVLDLDTIAKQLMQNNEYLRSQIKEEFGNDAYNGDELNRGYIAEIAFKRGQVGRLNALVHPAVYEEVERLEFKIAEQGQKIIAKESALLLQHGRPKDVDFIIWVQSSREIRRNRLSKRPHSTQRDLDARIQHQSSLHLSQHLDKDRDIVLYNNETIQALHKKVSQLTLQLKTGCDTLLESRM